MLNDIEFVLNCDLIETVTENPDTTIRLTTGKMYIVKESMEEVLNASVNFRKNIFKNLLERGSRTDVSEG